MDFLVKKIIFFLKNPEIHEKKDEIRMNLRFIRQSLIHLNQLSSKPPRYLLANDIIEPLKKSFYDRWKEIIVNGGQKFPIFGGIKFPS